MKPFQFALRAARMSAALSFAMLLANFAYAAQATLSTPRWDMTYDTTQLTDAGWAVELSSFGFGQGPPSMDVLIQATTGAPPTFGTANLSFVFKTQRSPLYDVFTGLQVMGFEVVTTSNPAIITFSTQITSSPPANAQLTTSYGRETIAVLAEGTEQSSVTRSILGSRTGGLVLGSGAGGLVLGGPSGGGWASAPLSPNGSWNLVLTHEVIGSNHLVPSLDPGCVNVLCMPAERAAVQLQNLLIAMPFNVDVVAAISEPEAYALMLSGFAMISWISRRRLRNPGERR